MDVTHLIKYFALLGLPAVLVLLFTPLLIRYAPALGLLDTPDERRIHKKPTALGGGIIIFIAFHLGCYLLYQHIWPAYDGPLDQTWWHAFLIASGILLLVGVIDDIKGMPAIVKLTGQTFACLSMFVLHGKSFYFFGTETIGYFNLLFTLGWYLVIVNAFNLIDGLDGLCTGLALISSLGLAAVYILQGNSASALICLALAGGCLGFLRYNYHPASIFLGDTGSMFLGFTLASISLYAGGKSSFFIAIATPFFIAGVPIIDTLLAIWRRTIRKALAEKNQTVGIMHADKDHLHHRLLAMGFNQHRVALVLYGVNALIVICGLIYVLAGDLAIGFFLIIFIATVYLLVKHVLQIERWETTRVLANFDNTAFPMRINLIYHPLFDLLWMTLSLTLAQFLIHKGALPYSDLHEWVVQLPAWIMPTFVLLFLTHSYNTIWRNAFFKDYLYLTLSVFTGSLLSTALNSLLADGFSFTLINHGLIFCIISFTGITGVRILFHFIREWGMNATPPANANISITNILLYGAGIRGGLYMRERYLKHSSELGLNNIVGFIDDDQALRKRRLYGKPVFGGIDEIQDIVKKKQIDQIIITTPLSDDSFQSLVALARELKVTVTEWKANSTVII